LVHANVPFGLSWPEMVERLSDPDCDNKFIESIIWSRDRINQQDDAGVAGIGRVFVGHTPVTDVKRLGNVYHIDTGAVFGLLRQSPEVGRMTMADLSCATQVFDQPVPHDRHFTIFLGPEKTAPARPFGHYAKPRR
jgi:serine/threonine protein phosphatase 1